MGLSDVTMATTLRVVGVPLSGVWAWPRPGEVGVPLSGEMGVSLSGEVGVAWARCL